MVCGARAMKTATLNALHEQMGPHFEKSGWQKVSYLFNPTPIVGFTLNSHVRLIESILANRPPNRRTYRTKEIDDFCECISVLLYAMEGEDGGPSSEDVASPSFRLSQARRRRIMRRSQPYSLRPSARRSLQATLNPEDRQLAQDCPQSTDPRGSPATDGVSPASPTQRPPSSSRSSPSPE
ncbi:hypothetical protein ON010_g15600 [Phytophthora cinnamomi]|nr:hypothetical protein ON010_g15600 [Phytophthora cinnamomi]